MPVPALCYLSCDRGATSNHSLANWKPSFGRALPVTALRSRGLLHAQPDQTSDHLKRIILKSQVSQRCGDNRAGSVNLVMWSQCGSFRLDSSSLYAS